MCGRYRLTRADRRLNESFDAEGDFDIVPRYNIAPSQPVLTIRREPGRRRQFSTMRWGLVPSWAKDPSVGFKTINARAETVQTTPSFRDPFKSQRCLIPADGFYEWARNGKTKQPYCFEVGDGEVFAFAGLWDRWVDPNGNILESCTIMTTTPNSLLSNFHDRMPVILHPENYAAWLTPGNTDAALEMLKPSDRMMRSYPVSTRLNQVQNDDPDCGTPLELGAPQQGLLF
jgi:putative SOS response-associated peptidase YedK